MRVKWPNDVLVNREKVPGILIESATPRQESGTTEYWYLIGVGVNVGWAPDVPTEGADRGRKATSLSRYCEAVCCGRRRWSSDGGGGGRDRGRGGRR